MDHKGDRKVSDLQDFLAINAAVRQLAAARLYRPPPFPPPPLTYRGPPSLLPGRTADGAAGAGRKELRRRGRADRDQL